MRLVVGGKVVRATTGGRPLDPKRPLVVFVHGAGMDRTVWALQTRYFANHGWSVLAVDLPGHSGSEGPPPPTVPDAAAWLAECIATAGWERAALVGHSLGSYIGLHLAAERPEMVTHLMLVSTAATMPVHPELLAAAKAGEHRAYELMTAWSFGRQSHLGGHPTPGLWKVGGSTRLFEHAAPGALYTDLVASCDYGDAVEKAKQVACPTLVLLGDEDRMTPSANAAPLIAALPDPEVVVLEGCGHMAPIERPDEVIDAIAGFLAR